MPIKQLNVLYQTVVTSFNSVWLLPFLCVLRSKKNSVRVRLRDMGCIGLPSAIIL